MNLITPDFGLIFWMLIGFGILFFILAKFAWPVITKSIAQREEYIQEQLDAADTVKREMKNLQAEHHKLLQEAKEERDKILADARKIVDKMNEEARILRDKEHDARMAETKIAIQNEKMKALTDIKNEIALLSIDVAEKILSEELSTQTKQEEMISKWVNELNLN
ncbi:MAG TPA: F0F1 ATP synthase subunit B [Bacteroidales bacterium]|nr:F0F1 ATP synthase subunit B [Bacteroidales bacterium]HOH23376.1 F0F1 ATP synthase subunit B [Bacteroidales bacterium]HPB58085.1 F0F1 ATP synthase subunit B [Bacteroidales bacterium]HPZ04021.1 F0F1 ATP synthase subunit B [Bacteroidales bacterium]HQB75664.1 F0F1 ATP synthase subunit B [Bacteroidales bacterium]